LPVLRVLALRPVLSFGVSVTLTLALSPQGRGDRSVIPMLTFSPQGGREKSHNRSFM